MCKYKGHCGLRDFVVFLAGAEFFHTLSHVLLPYFMTLPVDMKVTALTAEMNMWAIFINGIITLLLLWWAHRLGRQCGCACMCGACKHCKAGDAE